LVTCRIEAGVAGALNVAVSAPASKRDQPQIAAAARAKVPCDVVTVAHRHADVEHRNVRAERLGHLDG
jgi:hypothetical protein